MVRNLSIFFSLTMTTMSYGANYSASKVTVDGLGAVRLADARAGIRVTVFPSFGNNACEVLVKGQNIMWWSTSSVAEAKAKPVQTANPLLAPWAGRLDGDAYWIGENRYLLNSDLKNFRRDPNGKPMHGLLQFTGDWKVTRVEANEREAVTTSRLEVWRRPEWMAQFPFAMNIEMTHRLKDGALEVETVVENVSAEAFPISLGYHTYYRLFDAPRDEWRVHVAARKQMVTDNLLLPNGETAAVNFPDPVRLKDAQFDTAYTDLVRDAKGMATFWVQGKSQKISVTFGPKYPVAVLFAPDDPQRQFICFEPMAAAVNVFNLLHAGKIKDAQIVPAGGVWRESYWIRPEGF